jgi:hypothetical protein
MVALGLVPALHVTATLTPVALVMLNRCAPGIAVLAPLTLYLLPPLVVNLMTWIRPLPAGPVDLGSPVFLHWWFTAQWQIVFARLPFLEELLRLIPGVYSMWLRLWGARIGSLVYWSPGVVILDRSLVRIGSRVVFGIGVRINPHVIAPDRDGSTRLFIAPVTVGDDVLVGGYSHLLAGCSVAAGEVTPPFRSLHAFSRWERGRRISNASGAPDQEVR